MATASRLQPRPLSATEVRELREAFDVLVPGVVGADAPAVRAVLRGVGVEISGADARALVASADAHDVGWLTFAQLCSAVAASGCMRAREGAAGAARVFALFDSARSGRVSAADIVRVARELGEDLGDAEAADLVAAADSDGDGFVSFADFARVLRRAARAAAGGAADAGGGGSSSGSSSDDGGGAAAR
jgi:Ca2+-binding EF-hand superfamily protein